MVCVYEVVVGPLERVTLGEVQEAKVGKIEKDKVVSFEWGGSGVNCVVVITLELKGKDKTIVKITESDWLADYKGANCCMGQVEG